MRLWKLLSVLLILIGAYGLLLLFVLDRPVDGQETRAGSQAPQDPVVPRVDPPPLPDRAAEAAVWKRRTRERLQTAQRALADIEGLFSHELQAGDGSTARSHLASLDHWNESVTAFRKRLDPLRTWFEGQPPRTASERSLFDTELEAYLAFRDQGLDVATLRTRIESAKAALATARADEAQERRRQEAAAAQRKQHVSNLGSELAQEREAIERALQQLKSARFQATSADLESSRTNRSGLMTRLTNLASKYDLMRAALDDDAVSGPVEGWRAQLEGQAGLAASARAKALADAKTWYDAYESAYAKATAAERGKIAKIQKEVSALRKEAARELALCDARADLSSELVKDHREVLLGLRERLKQHLRRMGELDVALMALSKGEPAAMSRVAAAQELGSMRAQVEREKGRGAKIAIAAENRMAQAYQRAKAQVAQLDRARDEAEWFIGYDDGAQQVIFVEPGQRSGYTPGGVTPRRHKGHGEQDDYDRSFYLHYDPHNPRAKSKPGRPPLVCTTCGDFHKRAYLQHRFHLIKWDAPAATVRGQQRAWARALAETLRAKFPALELTEKTVTVSWPSGGSRGTRLAGYDQKLRVATQGLDIRIAGPSTIPAHVQPRTAGYFEKDSEDFIRSLLR